MHLPCHVIGRSERRIDAEMRLSEYAVTDAGHDLRPGCLDFFKPLLPEDGDVTDDTDDTDDEEDFESELVEAVELLDKCLRVMERITVKGGRIRSVPVKELTDLLEEIGELLEGYPEIG